MTIDNLCPEIERILALASIQAEGRHNYYVQVEDLLVGIVLEGDNAIVQTLRNYGCNIESIREYYGSGKNLCSNNKPIKVPKRIKKILDNPKIPTKKS